MIFVDLFIIIMLVVTIVFCIKLNRKIELVQQGKKDFALLFKNFDTTIQKVENSIAVFQQAAKRSSYELEDKTKSAKQIIDELTFVTSKANNTLELLKHTYAAIQNANNVTKSSNNNNSYSNELLGERIDHNLANTKIIASNDQSPPKNDILAETKRLAIEDLLHKISEIQKKAGQNN